MGRKDEAAGYTGSWKHKSLISEIYGVRSWQILIVGKIFGHGPPKENIKVGNGFQYLHSSGHLV